MREDRSPGIFLTILFGVLGLTVLMLAWLWPATASDRIIAILVGSAGLFWALVRIPSLRHSPGRTDDEQVPVNVKAEEKS